MATIMSTITMAAKMARERMAADRSRDEKIERLPLGISNIVRSVGRVAAETCLPVSGYMPFPKAGSCHVRLR